MTSSQHLYEVRPRKDHRGVDLISDALPFGRLWYGESNAASNAIGYAKFCSRSHNAVIRICDESGNVIEQGVSATEFCSTKWQRANFGSLNSDESGIRIGEHFMPGQPVPNLKFEIGHVLFIDIVGYS